MGVKQALRSIDAFPRADDHLLQKTQSGAVVSIVGLIIMATLFLHELSYYLNTRTLHQDTDNDTQPMQAYTEETKDKKKMVKNTRGKKGQKSKKKQKI